MKRPITNKERDNCRFPSSSPEERREDFISSNYPVMFLCNDEKHCGFAQVPVDQECWGRKQLYNVWVDLTLLH